MSTDGSTSCCAPSCCGGATTTLERAPGASAAPAAAPWTLRTARDGDLAAVRALLAAAALPADDIAPILGDAFAVAESGGDVIGAAGVERHGDDGLLRSVVVHPAWRGRGVGEALGADRVRWARERGLRSLWLLTTTAAGFFPRLGFAAAERGDAPAALQGSAEFAHLCPSTATTMRLDLAARAAEEPQALRAQVRERYGAAARAAAAGDRGSCCGGAPKPWDPITSDLYAAGEAEGIPAAALLASLGCGNPTALAELAPGETVLDLGSGGGIDVLLSARRVGPAGKVYGLDMTDEMLALARENQRRAGATNVEFLKGEIEAIPLPDAAVDVIVSNCVINLSADKGRVLREAFRVLRPGGRFAVSDIVLRGALPDELRRDLALWTGCVAGALTEDEYRALLAEAGFGEIGIEPTRVYGGGDARALLAGSAVRDPDALAAAVDGKVMSAFVRARKPA